MASIGATLSRFVRPLAEEARASGWETIACAEGASGLSGFSRVHELPPFRRRGPGATLGAFRELQRVIMVERPTVLHLHTPTAIALGRIAAKGARVPSVSVVHGTFLDDRSWRRVAFALTEAMLAWLSTTTVVLNDEDAHFYRRICRTGTVRVAPVGGIGVNARRLAVAPSESNSERVTLVADRDCRQSALLARMATEGPVVLYLGRLAADKNLDLLVTAWLKARQVVPDLRLRIVGAAVPGDPLWAVPQHLGIETAPWTDDPGAEYAGASVVVSVSRREGYSMLLSESLIAGLPAVAVTNRGSRHVFREVNEGLTLVGNDEDELAAAIVRAIGVSTFRSPRTDLVERWSEAAAIKFHLSVLEAAATPSRVLDG